MEKLLEESGAAGHVALIAGQVGLLLGVLSLVLVALKRSRAAVVIAALVVGTGCAAMLLGWAGEAAMTVENERMLSHLDAEQRVGLRENAAEEAHGAATLGLGAGLSTALFGALAMGAAFARGGRR